MKAGEEIGPEKRSVCMSLCAPPRKIDLFAGGIATVNVTSQIS